MNKTNQASMHLLNIALGDTNAEMAVSMMSALKQGLIFVDERGAMYSAVSTEIFKCACEVYKIDPRMANQTFYKFFEEIPELQRFIDQVTHYFTTYGAEAVGIDIPTYIPKGVLDIPDLECPAFRVIRIMGEKGFRGEVEKYFRNTKRFKASNAPHVKGLIPYANRLDVSEIASFEAMMFYCEHFDVVPRHPMQALRYLIYKITGETLIIKNKILITQIKSSISAIGYGGMKGAESFAILQKMDRAEMAKIFYRFKPIFLAFREYRPNRPIINSIRRLADCYHEPLSPICIQNYFTLKPQNQVGLLRESDNMTLVKLLKASLVSGENRLYQVRNGKVFVTEKAADLNRRNHTELIGRELMKRLGEQYCGRYFLFPQHMEYAAPTSEKQFIGNFPWGTIISLPGDAMTVGIHWFDQGERTDIDLHAHSFTEGEPIKNYGWNSRYSENDDGEEIYFTGDLVEAPKPLGAAEAFMVKLKGDHNISFDVCLYGGDSAAKFDLFFTARENKETYKDRKYTFDPNKQLIPKIPLAFSPQNTNQTIGLLHKTEGNTVFTLYGGVMSSSRVPAAHQEKFIKATLAELGTAISLRAILHEAGAKVIHDIKQLPEEDTPFVNLMPEELSATTLVDLVEGRL